VLTEEKSGQKHLRSIFNPTHHFVLLCLDFLAVRMAFVRKCCLVRYLHLIKAVTRLKSMGPSATGFHSLNSVPFYAYQLPNMLRFMLIIVEKT